MSAETPLNSQEVLGLLSSRMIHAFSNQLVIITGNICAATRLQHNKAECAAALHAAISAANQTGRLLDQLAQCRRQMSEDLGSLPAEELIPLLEGWCAQNGDWCVRENPSWRFPAGARLPLGGRIVRFLLESLRDELPADRGELAVVASASRVQIELTYSAKACLDWEKAKEDFSRPGLTAIYQILSQLPSRPGASIISGQDKARVVLPIPFIPA